MTEMIARHRSIDEKMHNIAAPENLSFVLVFPIRPSTMSELTDVYTDDGNKGKNKLITDGRWIDKQPVTVLAIFIVQELNNFNW